MWRRTVIVQLSVVSLCTMCVRVYVYVCPTAFACGWLVVLCALAHCTRRCRLLGQFPKVRISLVRQCGGTPLDEALCGVLLSGTVPRSAQQLLLLWRCRPPPGSCSAGAPSVECWVSRTCPTLRPRAAWAERQGPSGMGKAACASSAACQLRARCSHDHRLIGTEPDNSRRSTGHGDNHWLKRRTM